MNPRAFHLTAPVFVKGNVEFVCEEAFSVFFGISTRDAAWITVLLEGHTPYPNHPTYCEEYQLPTSSSITPRHAADRIRKVLQRVDPDALTEVGDAKPKLAEVTP